MSNTYSSGGGPETVLKKYPNRRIYDPTRNCHVTLAEIADRVKLGERIRIVDNQSGEDLTHTIMGQVLFETLKSRPDYLPLDLVVLMIRAQDTMVRDFLFHGVPQAFQMYLEAQRRMMSGMPWGTPTYQAPFSGMMNPFSSFFSGQNPSGAPPTGFSGQTPVPPSGPTPPPPAGTPPGGAPPSGSPPAGGPPQGFASPSSFPADGLRDEVSRLRAEVEALKHREHAAPRPRTRKQTRKDGA